MERRNSRPYLRQNGTDSVDKFLKNINLSSNNYRGNTTSKFQTDGYENSKYSLYSNPVGKYTSGLLSTASSSASGSGNYSSRFNVPTTMERRRSSGVRLPLYNLTKNSTYIPRSNFVDNGSRFADGGCDDYASQRTGSIPTVRDGAKKHKSALKSLRSFFKRHLIGGSRGRRDLSATPLKTRFSSTQNVNGHFHSYNVLINHRRSSSSSTEFINETQQHSSSSLAFNSARDSLKRSSTVLPNNVNYLHSSIGDSDSSTRQLQRRIEDMSISKPDVKTITVSRGEIEPIKSSNFYFDRQFPQKRPVTPDDELSSVFYSPRQNILEKSFNSKVNIPCLKGLANHGNTCYFSAIIQCLSACEKFAEFLICNDSKNSDKETLFNSFVATLRCLWFNNPNADSFCFKTLRFIGEANPQFIISHQQDSHECLIWLLNRLHEEIKGNQSTHINNDHKLRIYKSEEELASDALKRISGSSESTIMDLFRGQFRSSLKCTNPTCGFKNLTFDPYLCVSLSVPLAQKLHNCSVLFIAFVPVHKVVRVYFTVPDSSMNVKYFKDRIVELMISGKKELVAFNILSNGQMRFLADDFQLDNNLELTILEFPYINEKLAKHLIVAAVQFVIGIVPNSERFENPVAVLLNKSWDYDTISNFLLKKASHLMPRSFYPLPQDYTILIQHNDQIVGVLDIQTKKPLNTKVIDDILNDKNNGTNVLRILVEWNLSLKHDFLSRVEPEPIINDYSFRRNEALDYNSMKIPVSLNDLINDYVKFESIRDWICPRCKTSRGSMELRFHSLPDILVFHLKRFELLSENVTKKIDSLVKIPIDELDMSPYLYNQNLNSTLPKNKKDKIEKKSMIYDLVGVIYHFGERTNSGHYTAATRNPIDSQWRIFDDSRVSIPIELNEISVSSRSYLLFYQRRPYVQRHLPWFPLNVPYHIVQKYQRKIDERVL